ncbi:hypothetical protein DICVIV_09324 [Dictyocaulus viviparus]|uniref:Uncharacterized protein n=1 Tax=Dictyocaulus viviparus TaxID=29172 RepID=A0A0D8XQI9_DICVI|nr:hypothetical protein DICVIV_09324 [Dictyocaulus viviparus]
MEKSCKAQLIFGKDCKLDRSSIKLFLFTSCTGVKYAAYSISRNLHESNDCSFTTVFPFHHRVFYCRDVDLYKPNYVPEDFDIYVSDTLLYCLGFALPPFVGMNDEANYLITYTELMPNI